MPASRRARAMILAPRSCPSRPGLAITTRIFRSMRGAVYGRETDRRGLLAGVAESRRGAIRLPDRRAGPRPARLRTRRARAPARDGLERLAPRRRRRRHALASRPLGRSRPLGLGDDGRPRAERRAARALAAAAGPQPAAAVRAPPRLGGHVRDHLPAPGLRGGGAVPSRRA